MCRKLTQRKNLLPRARRKFRLKEENYELNFVGALLGLDIGCSLYDPTGKFLIKDMATALNLVEGLLTYQSTVKLMKKWQPLYGPLYLIHAEPILTEAWIAVFGLYYTYTDFDEAKFCAEYSKQVINPTSTDTRPTETMLVIAKAVYWLARREIMPEDLLSAILDVLPFDYFHPSYQKLLVAQDYLEERQTLVDNVEAGEIAGVDLQQTDFKNVNRLWAKSIPNITAYDVLAAACYLFAARKDSFEEVMNLAFMLEDTNPDLPPLLGVLAGAYHGQEAIPDAWKAKNPDYEKIVETARLLNEVQSEV